MAFMRLRGGIGMISIAADFECGNAKQIRQIAIDRFRLEVVGDKATYCYYFCFDVRNDGPVSAVTVEVWPDSRFGPEGFVAGLPTTVWVGSPGEGRFKPLDRDRVRNTEEPLLIRLNLKANETIRVTNAWSAPYSDTRDTIRKLAEERGDRCEAFTIGKSVQGRDIIGIRTGTPGKPRILCVAGQHAVEFSGTWGMLGIADFITSLVPDAVALREQIQVEVLPVVNPDGNVMGRNAFNAEGLDMYRAFGEDPEAAAPEARESRLLWDKLLADRPALWMNIHAFVGWRENGEYPYDGWYEVVDPVFENPDRARLYQALCDTMRLETHGMSTHGRANVHRENTMCYQMARRLGIPSVFYETNVATAGPHGSAGRAIHVFKRAVHTLLNYR